MMIERTHPSSLSEAEVLDRVLDRGIVIDALSHVSIAGTELVTLRAHVVVASIDTYLKYFAEDAGVANPRPAHSKSRRRGSRQAARVIDFPAFLPD
jgi:gas vesicle structural protein